MGDAGSIPAAVLVINSFTGQYAFLSNFYPSMVYFEGVDYPTVEHAYQAAKTEIEIDREEIALAPTPVQAKALGKRLLLRPHWDTHWRYKIMKQLVRQKFQEYFLARMLEDTDGYKLVEGNYWGDTYWGVCNGVGKNQLGKILMEIRDEKLGRK